MDPHDQQEAVPASEGRMESADWEALGILATWQMLGQPDPRDR
jgi:hypothetical protein